MCIANLPTIEAVKVYIQRFLPIADINNIIWPNQFRNIWPHFSLIIISNLPLNLFIILANA